MGDNTKIITIPVAPPKMVLLNCKVDLAKMCRTCGEKCKDNVSLLHIFKDATEEIKISKMLTTCTSLEVQLGDGLPMIICLGCMSNLLNVYQFIKKCKNTDLKMRKYVFDDNCPYINENAINNNNAFDNFTIPFNTLCQNDMKTIEKVKTGCRKRPVEIIESLRNKIGPDKDILFEQDLDIMLHNINYSDTLISDESSKSDINIALDTNEYDLETELLSSEYGYDIEEIIVNDVTDSKDNDCDTKLNIYESKQNEISEEVKKKLYRWKKTCPYCSKTLYKIETYRIHIKLHAGIFPFKCSICEKQYKYKGQLNHHQKLKHPKDLNLVMQCRRIDCELTFASWAELQAHRKTHIKNYYQCDICKKTFNTRKTYSTHKKKHLGILETFSCEICGKILTSQPSAYMHSRCHKKQYSEICSICGKGFYTPYHLRKHKMAAHSDMKLFQCEICGKALKSLGSLNLHKLTQHVQKRQISCQLCPRKFVTRGQLNQHMQRHNKEYRFSCEVCNHQVYTGRELKIHKLRHTGERPLKCLKCPKSYTRPQLYKQHMARHQGPFIQCDVCYSFLRPEFFDKHRIGHDNKKKRDENQGKIDDIENLDED